MRPSATVPLAITLLVFAILGGSASFILIASSWTTSTGESFNPPAMAIGFTVAALISTLVGCTLAIKRPGNPIGWLFLLEGLVGVLDIGFERYLLYTLVEGPTNSLPDLSGLGGLSNGLWLIPMTCTVLVLVTFPLGRTVSRPWTIAASAVIFLASVALILTLVDPAPFAPPLDSYRNRLRVEAYADYTFVFDLIMLIIAGIALVAAGSLFRRFLRSVGDEHEQIKWFLYVVAWLPPLVISYVVTSALGITSGVIFDVLSFATIAMIALLPIAIGFAVLKYRLYDIDLLINRTLVYVPLTAILAGIFSASTALTRTLFTEISGQASDAAVAATTIAIVGLFTPVKNQLQSFVDRLFKEAADPAKPLRTLSADARRVFNLLDAEAFIQEFADKAAAAFGATNALVYLNGKSTPIVISGDATVESVLSFPLIESGTHVGKLDIGPSRQSRPFTPAMVDAMEAQTDVLARGLVFYAAAMGLEIERPDQNGPGVVSSVSEELGVL